MHRAFEHILVHFSCAPTCGRLIYTMLASVNQLIYKIIWPNVSNKQK